MHACAVLMDDSWSGNSNSDQGSCLAKQAATASVAATCKIHNVSELCGTSISLGVVSQILSCPSDLKLSKQAAYEQNFAHND